MQKVLTLCLNFALSLWIAGSSVQWWNWQADRVQNQVTPVHAHMQQWWRYYWSGSGHQQDFNWRTLQWRWWEGNYSTNYINADVCVLIYLNKCMKWWGNNDVMLTSDLYEVTNNYISSWFCGHFVVSLQFVSHLQTCARDSNCNSWSTEQRHFLQTSYPEDIWFMMMWIFL